MPTIFKTRTYDSLSLFQEAAQAHGWQHLLLELNGGNDVRVMFVRGEFDYADVWFDGQFRDGENRPAFLGAQGHVNGEDFDTQSKQVVRDFLGSESKWK